MRSSSCSICLNSGSSTIRQGAGWFTASRMWVTILSRPIFSAAAIFSLVENLLPRALPPSRSSKSIEAPWSFMRMRVAEQSSLVTRSVMRFASEGTESLTVMGGQSSPAYRIFAPVIGTSGR